MLDSGEAVPYYGEAMTKEPALTPEKVRVALIAANGSPKGAAAILKVSRQTVHAWMRKHDIRIERRVVKAAS